MSEELHAFAPTKELPPSSQLAQSPESGQEPVDAVQPEHSDMEFPKWIWTTMFVCYAVFFICMILATGADSTALFALIVSVGYTAMYFATAGILVGLKPPKRRSSFARGLAPLQTHTGPMSIRAVVGQVLAIPLALAIFGLATCIIIAVTF